MSSEEQRLRELLIKRGGYTDKELDELRVLAVEVASLPGDTWLRVGHFKVSIELIIAIKEFNRASGELVRRTNTLTVISIIVSFAALIIATLALFRK